MVLSSNLQNNTEIRESNFNETIYNKNEDYSCNITNNHRKSNKKSLKKGPKTTSKQINLNPYDFKKMENLLEAGNEKNKKYIKDQVFDLYKDMIYSTFSGVITVEAHARVVNPKRQIGCNRGAVI